MAYDLKQLQRKILVAQNKLLHKEFCFFGTLALWFKYRIDETVPTAGTNGKEIIFNPKFLEELSMGELKWVMAHEIMHVANGHIRRQGTRDQKLFNIAADYAIHSILKEFEADSFKMRKDFLYDKKYDGKCAEAIYNELYKEQDSGKDMSDKQTMDDHSQWGKADKGDGDSKDGEGDPQDGDSSGVGEDVSPEEWKQRMENAAKLAKGKMEGKIPTFLQDMLAKLQPPKKDWRQLLAEFIQPDITDYSFSPPDKRYSDYECLLPDFSETEETVKNIVFFIDISGSMSEDDIRDVYSEVVGAVNQFSTMNGYLGYFDTQVHNFSKFDDIEDILKNKPHSGGGTEFQVCFEYLNNTDKVEMDDVVGIIVLTDGECGYGKSEKLSKGIPVLWVYTDDRIAPAPFGSSTYLNYRDSL